ncbi:hypothetical protein U9M48_021658 [Paspalum notatum var. saurae]|uniref:IBH1-like N-terminal domain-containing protein n=1 Tax=Paspalum notatum var. saurae TaxID=547442 RepID=A0AAQ3TI15_PASNO
MSSSTPSGLGGGGGGGGGMPSSAGSSSGSKKFRHAILMNLLLGLRKEGGAVSSRGMSFDERRNAIRHAADAALADARGTGPRWSRSLAAELSQCRRCSQDPHLLLRRPAANGAPPSSSSSDQCVKPPPPPLPCKKVVRRRVLRARPKSRGAAKAAGAIARVMVRRRARALREIVPGGRGMTDGCTLLGETLDYAVSLKAQVDAMQLLLRTLQGRPKNPIGLRSRGMEDHHTIVLHFTHHW